MRSSQSLRLRVEETSSKFGRETSQMKKHIGELEDGLSKICSAIARDVEELKLGMGGEAKERETGS